MKTTLTTNANNRRTRWMIVDEKQETLSLVRDICARYDGVEIACFDSPQAALDAFEAEPEAFEFVLTDLEMPGQGGLELARRRRPLAPALNILLATWNDLVSEEEAVAKGFCGRIRKPFPFAALQRAVAPAVLKYIGRIAGVTHGLNLVPAW